MPRSRGIRFYNRVAENDDRDIESQEEEHYNRNNNVENVESSRQNVTGKPLGLDDNNLEEMIKIVLMDPAQKRFDILVDPSWSIARLKEEGFVIHKIPSSQQRLIYMGRLLSNDIILSDAKINKDGIIVHLFPKPRVVVQQNQGDQINNENNAGDGAHVPQIVLDPDEAEMRSSILVLGSAEILDAQNNVKLLSFLLLIITSMQLLALFATFLHVQELPTDDTTSNPNDHYQNVDTWKNSNYFELLLYLFGFYSAMLGIKATTENTRRLAFRYLICTVFCGIFWNVFYYYANYEEKNDKHPESEAETREMLVETFYGSLIPMAIWVMCCTRAYQFHFLLREAEFEAETRIQNELNMQVEDINNDETTNRSITQNTQ
mmetsp:Transcript_36797/g.41948  ORF Transcript_36797/g.41948 Transcript_36797/m.41948 type:complete len:376 (-) Transcript_36797:239-1366(-)|eukprot:CAMPEP_0194132050 /NCGR_PEP_ID=MMETSP0152-20130528/2612_1 /TAXON_ID=1049557 /ORGANISM="Thalassiothrix antarctica, Strain L6-D1" /LENGTH=375 /DNA_ID=CAMNT_0038826967 /DNA_START=64 /DNA_END=1191 /DNA_ORIENTATION=+